MTDPTKTSRSLTSPLERHREQLAAELMRAASNDRRHRVRHALRRGVVVPVALLAIGGGVATAAVVSGGEPFKEIPGTVGDGSEVTLDVPIACDAEARWWEDRLADQGGSIKWTVERADGESGPGAEVASIGERPPADICGDEGK